MGTGKLVAGITTSVDGYYAGPDDGPGRGLGVGGERLHYWVFGGPWTYADQDDLGEATGEDKAYLDQSVTDHGAVVCGRGTYDAAEAWGGHNPWRAPFFVLTHRVEEQPDDEAGFVFVPDLDTAVRRAREAAGDQDVLLMGGGDLIRQALEAGILDELTVSVAPVILGRGKRLFEGFSRDVDLEKLQTWSSPLATHVRYAVKR